uniref:Centrosomal protein 20 n=1 Tax=Amphimedon queenslandica TaxID=400682 RepID=A0A1X7VJW2_AMPQE
MADDLKKIIKETLRARGTWNEIKSHLTSEVVEVLDEKEHTKPKLNRENYVINELIQEYLQFNNYKYTSAVLTQESGQTEETLPRDIVARELQIPPDDSNLPLLYRIVNHLAHST